MAEKLAQTALQKASTEAKEVSAKLASTDKKATAFVAGGDRDDMVQVRLTRRFQDLQQMHPVGTILTIPRDLAPKSAVVLTPEKEAKAEEPAKTSAPEKKA